MPSFNSHQDQLILLAEELTIDDVAELMARVLLNIQQQVLKVISEDTEQFDNENIVNSLDVLGDAGSLAELAKDMGYQNYFNHLEFWSTVEEKISDCAEEYTR